MRASQWLLERPVNAGVIAALLHLVPFVFWLGSAIIALFVLRKGWAKSFSPLVISLSLLAVYFLVFSDPTALFVLVTSICMALVLRQTVNLPLALFAGTVFTTLLAMLLPVAMPDLAATLSAFIDQVMAQLDPEVVSELKQSRFFRDDEFILVLALGVFSFWYFLASVISLFLARSEQAKLFNPGGFRSEFHHFRITLPLLGAVLLCWLAAPFVGRAGIILAMLTTVPVVLAGIALVHWFVARKQLNAAWLVAFYIGLVIFGPSMVAVIWILAIVDALVNFRSRVRRSGVD